MLSIDIINQLFYIDLEEGLITWKIKRSNTEIGKEAGRITKGYKRIRIFNKEYQYHRIIWFVVKGVWPEKDIDHIDGNKLNNRIVNLRLASAQENSFNKQKLKNNTSGYKGVTWHKTCNKWQSSIMVNNKRLHLGTFQILEDAAIAYNEAAIKYHGEFAVLNEVNR